MLEAVQFERDQLKQENFSSKESNAQLHTLQLQHQVGNSNIHPVSNNIMWCVSILMYFNSNSGLLSSNVSTHNCYGSRCWNTVYFDSYGVLSSSSTLSLKC